MANEITLHDILSLHPALFSDEEIYRIETEGSVLFLEVYANSDYGCEFTLYDENHDEVDGGVVDDCYSEDETEVAQIILDLLEDLDVHGTSISKLPQEDVADFEEAAQKRWEAKVADLKAAMDAEKGKKNA